MRTVGKQKIYLESRFHRNFDAFHDPILKFVCHFSKESTFVLFLCVEPMQVSFKFPEQFPEQYSFSSLHVTWEKIYH